MSLLQGFKPISLLQGFKVSSLSLYCKVSSLYLYCEVSSLYLYCKVSGFKPVSLLQQTAALQGRQELAHINKHANRRINSGARRQEDEQWA